jgi:hypothetical protein
MIVRPRKGAAGRAASLVSPAPLRAPARRRPMRGRGGCFKEQFRSEEQLDVSFQEVDF